MADGRRLENRKKIAIGEICYVIFAALLKRSTLKSANVSLPLNVCCTVGKITSHIFFWCIVDNAGRQQAPSGEPKHHVSARSQAGSVQGKQLTVGIRH